MNVALKRALSAVDLNFNSPSFSLGQVRDCAREYWGLEGELLPLVSEGFRPNFVPYLGSRFAAPRGAANCWLHSAA